MRRDGSRSNPEIPFRSWLETATGVLGWTPETFWKSSVIEFLAAIEAWSRLQRGKVGQPDPVTREEAEDMFAEAERVVARIAAKKAASGSREQVRDAEAV